MPRIKAEIDANISPFERKLREATEKAREFAKGVSEGSNKAINAATGGIGGNLLGMAGAGAAGAAIVEGFKQVGEMLIDSVKEGVKAFSDFEQGALHLGYKAGNPNLGNEIMERIHGMSGAGGDEKTLAAAYGHLLDAGMQDNEENFKKFQALNKIAVGSGEDIESMTQGFRRAEMGGLDVGEAAGKLLRNNPYMGNLIREEMKTQRAGLAASRAGMFSADRGEEWQAEMDKLNNTSIADWVKGGNLTEDKFWQMVAKATNPGALYADAIDRAANTVAGTEAEKKKAEEENKKEQGEEEAPGYKELQQTMTDINKAKAPFDKAFGAVTGAGMEYLSRGINSAFNLSGPKLGDPGKGTFGEIQKAAEQTNKLLGDSVILLGHILGVFRN